MSTAVPALSRRERKNRRTQQAIIRATAELTLEGSFATATIAKIAERADVAPRTVSMWFPVKDDILFADLDDRIHRLKHHLSTGDGDFADRLLRWLAEEAATHDEDRYLDRLRQRAIVSDPHLRAHELERFIPPMREAIASWIATDRQIDEHSIGPQMLAATAMGFLLSARESFISTMGPEPERFETGMRMLRAAHAALGDT